MRGRRLIEPTIVRNRLEPGGVVFNDSGSGTIPLSGARTESHSRSVTVTGTISLSGARSESQLREDSLTDDFADGVIDTVKWLKFEGTGYTVSETGGRLRIVDTYAVIEAQAGVIAQDRRYRFPATDFIIYAESPTLGNTHLPNSEMYIVGIESVSGSDEAIVDRYDNNVEAWTRSGGTWSFIGNSAGATCAAARIRTAGGNWIFEFKPTLADAWISLGSIPAEAWASVGIRPKLVLNHWDFDGASQTAEWDNFRFVTKQGSIPLNGTATDEYITPGADVIRRPLTGFGT